MDRFTAPALPLPPVTYSLAQQDQLLRALRTYFTQLDSDAACHAYQYTTSRLKINLDAVLGAGPGELTWNAQEDTLNLGHSNGAVQQIGQETYMHVHNNTGVTIPNGTIVGFAGASSGHIDVAPYLANAASNPLYFVGVTTVDIPDTGQTGFATLYGKVRGLDTSMWATGTILYASPTVAGAFTSTRPTAPDSVIVVAAVTNSDATDGEIMVRPTVPLGLLYAAFSDTTVQTAAAVNTAYPIKFNTTDIARGISVVNDGSGNPTRLTVSEAGLYMVSVSNQYTSASANQKDIQTWLRKNGTDVANSNSYTTLALNGGTLVFATTYILSLLKNEYIQIMWATNDTNVSINSIAATGYSPAAPSAIVTVTQIQL